jgi:hypothetical protein
VETSGDFSLLLLRKADDEDVVAEDGKEMPLPDI